jgi:hypothetical protein
MSSVMEHPTMQDFYERWSHQDPLLHLSPSLPDGFLFRSIKGTWFEMAEEATAKAAADKNVEVGKRILVREIMSQTDNTIVQYGSEKTEKGWTRHIVAFRQGEESPFLLPDVLAVPSTVFATSFTTANAFAFSST